MNVAHEGGLGAESAATLVGPSQKLSSKELIVFVSLAVVAALVACWPLIRTLPEVWFGYETYYAHGAVVPICSAFIIWDQWPRIKSIPVKGANWALIPCLILTGLLWFVLRSGMNSLMSIEFVLLLVFGTWFVAGWGWTKALLVPTLYLLFGLPVFGYVIDRVTQPLQYTSRTIAFDLLKLAGQHPMKGEGSLIYLNTYVLDVAVPCSGLKTLLAVLAIVTFFVIVAKLKPWANLFLLALVLPLSLIVNGFRIMLIGMVGNQWGTDAAKSFHDYSGYIALVICSVVLYYITRALGWKS